MANSLLAPLSDEPALNGEEASIAHRTLGASELCHALAASEIDRLLGISKLKRMAASQRILDQGCEADAIYLPCSGTQLVERTAAGGQRQVLAFLQRGDFLGFGTSNKFFYSAQTLEESLILRINTRDFHAAADSIPQLRDNLGRITNQVLARVLDHLFAIGQKRAHERLAFLLWQLFSRQTPEERAHGLQLPMRRVDIGDYLGLTLETTSRAFSRLRSDAVIKTDGRQHVQILDADALSLLAEVK